MARAWSKLLARLHLKDALAPGRSTVIRSASTKTGPSPELWSLKTSKLTCVKEFIRPDYAAFRAYTAMAQPVGTSSETGGHNPVEWAFRQCSDTLTAEELTDRAASAATDAGANSPEEIDSLADQVAEKLPDFSANQLLAIITAFVNLRYQNRSFKEKIASSVASRLHEFDGPSLGQLVRTFARVYYDRNLFDEVADHLVHNLDRFDAHDLADIVYGYSKCGYRHVNLLRAVDAVACKSATAEDIEPKSMVALLDTYSRLGTQGPVVARIGDWAELHPHAFQRQELVTLVWSLSRLGYIDHSLFNALAPELQRCLEDCSAKEVVKVVVAYCDVGNLQPELLDKVADDIIPQRLSEFDVEGLRALVKACNRVGYYNSQLSSTLASLLNPPHTQAQRHA